MGKDQMGYDSGPSKTALGPGAAPESTPDPHDTYPAKLRLRNVQIGVGTGTVNIQTKQNSDLVCLVTLLASRPAVEEVPGERARLFERLNGMLVENTGSRRPPTKSQPEASAAARASKRPSFGALRLLRSR